MKTTSCFICNFVRYRCVVGHASRAGKRGLMLSFIGGPPVVVLIRVANESCVRGVAIILLQFTTTCAAGKAERC
jgi:hypothetical protein